MKRIQSVLCALALAISLSSTVLAGDIHGVYASGDIHGVNASGDIHGIKADTTDLLRYIAGVVVISILGDIHG